MRVIAMFRVSTERQENEGASLDAQQRRYRELAEAHGWTTVAEFRGQESAAKAASERAVLQRVLACVQEEHPEALWVYEQSRLSRGDELEVAMLHRELRERGVRLIVQSTVHDLTQPTDSLMVGFGSLLARHEWSLLKERTERGRREKARQGKKAGGTSPYGYTNPPKGDPRRGVLQPNEAEAAAVRRIFAAVAGGVSVREVCRELNAEGVPAPRGGAWAKSTLTRILDNPVYLGTQLCGAWVGTKGKNYRLQLDHPRAIVVENAHEALVSREEWAAARAQRVGASTGRPGLLTGLLHVMGERVLIDRSHGVSFYRQRQGTGGPWVRVEDVNRMTWRGYRSLVARPEWVVRLLSKAAEAKPEEQAGAADMGKRRTKLAARLERLVEMRADGEISRDVFQARSDECRTQLREVETAMSAAEDRRVASSGDYLSRAVRAISVLTANRKLDQEQKRRALLALVVRIDVQVKENTQPKDSRGRWEQAAKWTVEEVVMHLRRDPGMDTLAGSCDQTPVAVRVVSGGEPVRPHLAGRAARRSA